MAYAHSKRRNRKDSIENRVDLSEAGKSGGMLRLAHVQNRVGLRLSREEGFRMSRQLTLP